MTVYAAHNALGALLEHVTCGRNHLLFNPWREKSREA